PVFESKFFGWQRSWVGHLRDVPVVEALHKIPAGLLATGRRGRLRPEWVGRHETKEEYTGKHNFKRIHHAQYVTRTALVREASPAAVLVLRNVLRNDLRNDGGGGS